MSSKESFVQNRGYYMLIESFLQGQRNVIKVFHNVANSDHDNNVLDFFLVNVDKYTRKNHYSSLFQKECF